MKLKSGIVIFLIVALISLAVDSYYSHRTIKRQDVKIDRLTNNMEALLNDNASLESLILTEKEVTGRVKRERDSVAHLLKVKPKQVVEWKEIKIKDTDTLIVEVPVYRLKDSSFLIQDSGPCWKYEGIATVKSDSLNFKRTLFDYENKIDPVIHWKRKFPIFGKKKYFQNYFVKCGEVEVKEVKIVKDK